MNSKRIDCDANKCRSLTPNTIQGTQMTLLDAKTELRRTENRLSPCLSSMHIATTRNHAKLPAIVIHSPTDESSSQYVRGSSAIKKRRKSGSRRRKRSAERRNELLVDSSRVGRLGGSENESNYTSDSESRISSASSLFNEGRFQAERAINASDRRDQHYFMNHKRRGRFVIFNFETIGDRTRPGSEKDTERLQICFTKLGFQTEVLQNCTTSEMNQELNRLMANNYEDCDCFGMAILSHGENGQISTQNGFMRLDKIIKKVKRCESLLGKPKLIFVQSCRMEHNLNIDAAVIQNIPTASFEADLLVSFATTKGNVAYRIPDSGSPYIQKLTEILEDKGDKISLLDLLTEVSAKLKEKVQSLGEMYEQVSVFESTLQKKLQFDKVVAVYTEYSDGRIEYENKLDGNIQEQTYLKSTRNFRN